MSSKLQNITASLLLLIFIVGIGFSTTVFLKNDKILEDHIKYESRCSGDSLKIIMLEHKIDSLIKATKVNKKK